MTKLFKYRPLSDFLFKELYYQEIYFAAYNELNDPLDLSARIEFTPENQDQVDYLIYFLFKTSLKPLLNENVSGAERDAIRSISLLKDDKEGRAKFRTDFFNHISNLKNDHSFISFTEIIILLNSFEKELNLKFNIKELEREINRITDKFLANSYTTCFSEKNDELLMWSHYASKHSGICLEFSLDHFGLFPYVLTKERKTTREEYLKRMSTWATEGYMYWERVLPVEYQEEQPYINFFSFSPVFENENDCDLIGISKPVWHEYAYQLECAFTKKTNPWKYEKEWRAVRINFGERKEPEERIHHYPIEALSGIYFGIRTPENVKTRINRMFKNKKDVQFYEAKLINGNEIEFNIRENFEE